jgi:hypothetical protein
MTETRPDDPAGKNVFSLVLISLMKGVVYAETESAVWQGLQQLQTRGLELLIDEAEGYATLRQRVAAAGEPELPRLVPRRQLGYAVSLLLVLLRKKLAELDAQGGEARLILNREQIVDLVRLFMPAGANEVRLLDRLDTYINKVVELGFLRRLQGKDEPFEVRRIIKTFVDGQWLGEFDRRLAEYAAQATAAGHVEP